MGELTIEDLMWAATRIVSSQGCGMRPDRDAGWHVVRWTPLEIGTTDSVWVVEGKRQHGLIVAAHHGGVAHRALRAEKRRAVAKRCPCEGGYVSVYAVADEETAELEMALPGLTEALTVHCLRLLSELGAPESAWAAALLEPENVAGLADLVSAQAGAAQDRAMEQRAGRRQGRQVG